MHEDFLLQCLKLAKLRQGFCAPNPAVGAILVKDGAKIAEGVHWAAGEDHAEVNAIKQLGDNINLVQGATLYVSLEPCCHHGRTPPCTDLIINTGIAEVVYAFADPNPQVSGQGRKCLLAAGVACLHLAMDEIDSFYQAYGYWQQYGRPWLSAKIALSLDGKIASSTGEPVNITGEALQKFTHEQRRRSDAILTTIKTVLADDPALNVRLDNQCIAKPIYILDRRLQLTLAAQLHQTAARLIVFHANDVQLEQKMRLEAHGVNCVEVSSDDYGLNLNEVLNFIGKDGIHELWVEAGGFLFENLLQSDLINKAYIYIASRVLGADALNAFREKSDKLQKAKQIQWRSFAEDICCEILL